MSVYTYHGLRVESSNIHTGEGMATCDEAWPTGQGRQNHEHGGDLPPFFAHQGIPDRGLLSAQAQG